MKINKAYCLFEQSGTFKNQFKRLGIDAEDFDIQNEFGETDNVVDIFNEIENAYNEKSSIFDKVTKDDLIMAFFPCTRFESRIVLGFRGELAQMKRWDEVKKLEYAMNMHEELHHLYVMLSKMCIVAIKRGLRMIIENPYTQPHYLTTYFSLSPKVIDKDRTENGDYFKKPTQYFFINCEPNGNWICEPLEETKTYTIDLAHKMGGNCQTSRSLMHPQYARRFIIRYLLDCPQNTYIGEIQ